MRSSLRMSVSGRGLLCLIVMWFLVGFSFQPVQGNNIRINVPVKVSTGTGDTLVLEFPLQWDNSWRDEFNWDAAWVFLKYKVGTGDWKPVRLSFGGHSISGSSGQPVHFDYMPGQTGSNTFGLFVYPSRLESGNTPEIICKLKCLKSALGGMGVKEFADNAAFIRVQGIEMAYIPYGAYYLGDGVSNKSVKDTVFSSDKDIIGTDPSFVYSASSTYQPGPGPEVVADRVNNSLNNHVTNWQSGTSAADHLAWWMVDFGNARMIRSFGVSGASDYPTCRPSGTWFLEASNTAQDHDWVRLWSGGPEYWGTSVVSYPVRRPINVNNNVAYRYYRIRMEHSAYSGHAAYIITNISMSESAVNPTGVLIDSESSRSVLADGSYSITDFYPKGYKGFYTMKYELSQEQYVAFLNSLTYIQQQERVPGLASMKEGDYIFGDRTQPSNRNGICVAVASFNGLPVVFTNNLVNDKVYAQDNDGKTIACNYLSPNDMLGYCSWSGLRPMSELEYEKVCRSTYPELALSKGYAWNTTSVPGRLTSVANGGQKDEKSGTSGANVNAGNTFGPVRCGLFATTTPASNQQAAGATFWGVMEMSGNLKELCYNVNAASTFNGTILGDGTYAVNKWNNTIGNFGVRGGGFTSGDDLLRVSDRTEATGYFTSLEQHDSTVTFRGVYPIAGAVDAGTIEVVSVCPDKIEIKSVTGASSKFDLTYMWYVLKSGSSVWEMIPGKTGAAISNYVITEDFGTDASHVYKFKRKAVALVGEATTAEVSLTIPNMRIILSDTETFIDGCDHAQEVKATGYGSPTFEWKYSGASLAAGNKYMPSLSHFGGNGNFTVQCVMTSMGCPFVKDINVHIPVIMNVASSAVTMANCGDVVVVDNRDGFQKFYCTVKVGNQCWFGKNLNLGTYEEVNGNVWDFDQPGVQKWCNSNVVSNCEKYGALYEWWEVVCGGKCGPNLTQANAMQTSLSSESQLAQFGAKMVPGSTTKVQGLCPDGWHVPTLAEWDILMGAYGSNVSALKSDVVWDGTNITGWGGEPGNHHSMNGNFQPISQGYAYWWSTTPARDGSNLAFFYNMSGNSASKGASVTSKGTGMSVRCLLD